VTASVAAIIPASGEGKYLLNAVRSALYDDDRPDEVLIILNGARLGLAEDLHKLFGDLVQIVSIPEAIGAAAARNLGVILTTAEWIRFLDSDDVFMPNSTSQLLAEIKDPTRDIAIGRMQLIDDDAIPIRDLEIPTPAVGTVLFSRQLFNLVGMLDSAVKVGEFVDWFGRARALGVREVQTNGIVLGRRIHSLNTSTIALKGGNRDYLHVVRAQLRRRR
jgi:glycosyltransferase involved in cell wall biosynthesis